MDSHRSIPLTVSAASALRARWVSGALVAGVLSLPAACRPVVEGGGAADGGDQTCGSGPPNGWTFTRLVPKPTEAVLCTQPSVAIAGDTVLLGTPRSEGIDGPGAAVVFTHGDDWSELATLVSTDPKYPSDGFGSAVALVDDAAMVTIPLSYAGAIGTVGEAFVFTRDGGTWSASTILTSIASSESGEFGWNAAMAAGVAVVAESGIAGAGGVDPGAADVYVRNASGLYQPGADLQPKSAYWGTVFASDVATDGTTVVVAGVATNETTAVPAAWLYTRHNGAWTQAVEVRISEAALPTSMDANDPAPNVRVAIAGDTLAIGVSRYDLAGAVYVYRLSGATWHEEAKLVSADGYVGDMFGSSVAASGAVVAVGADHAYSSGTPDMDHGAAYVFAATGGGWEQRAKLLPAGCPPDQFGQAVAIDGGRVVVGGNYSSVCMAYLFEAAAP